MKKTKDVTAEQLIQVLKFTPCVYRIELGAYGGEVHAGRVDRKIYDYFKQQQIDLDEYVNDWDNELAVPVELQPFPPGSSYDCDDLLHVSGATMDASNSVQVFDESGKLVWSCNMDPNALQYEGVSCSETDSFDSDEVADGDVIFWGAQGEKGLLFGGEIALDAPFDPSLLTLNYCNADGWLICGDVEYAGEYINNDDYSTTGKWGENKWFIGGGEEVYEGVLLEDREDLAVSLDTQPELTNWFPKKIKPVHAGFYEVNINSWPWPTRVKWTGKKWDTEIEVKEWRGILRTTE